MIDFIEGLFGPYPFDAYGAVLVDDPELYYALETQAMSTFQMDFCRMRPPWSTSWPTNGSATR